MIDKTEKEILGRNPSLRKNMLRKFVSTDDFVPIKDMIQYLKESKKMSVAYTYISREHLKILTEYGLLEGPKYYSRCDDEKPLLSYKLKKNIDVLQFLFYNVYNSRIELMKTEYFKSMIEEVIEFFEINLRRTCQKELTNFDKEFLKISLRYSESSLDFIFCVEKYPERLDQFQNVILQNQIEFMDQGYMGGATNWMISEARVREHFGIKLDEEVVSKRDEVFDKMLDSAHEKYDYFFKNNIIFNMFVYYLSIDELRGNVDIKGYKEDKSKLISMHSHLICKFNESFVEQQKNDLAFYFLW